jgi:hypothetical protein
MAISSFNIVDFWTIPDDPSPTVVMANTAPYRHAGQTVVKASGGTVFTPPGVQLYMGLDGTPFMESLL